MADGNPFLGKSKTLRGFLAGVAGGTIVGMVLAYQFKEFLPGLTGTEKVAASFLLSTGTMIGDATGSFIKRRIGLASGQKAMTDAVTFMLFALGLALAAFPTVGNLLGFEGLLFVMGFTVVCHRFFNWIAHRLKLKIVPW